MDGIIKIIDFGSYQEDNPELLLLEEIFYTAPEVFSERYDEKCDMWSLGVIMF